MCQEKKLINNLLSERIKQDGICDVVDCDVDMINFCSSQEVVEFVEDMDE